MKKNGYTLIEILTVLAITGFVFTLGYGGFRTYSQRQQVTSVVRGINGDLKLAKEQAISGTKPAGCTGTFNGYKFSVEPNNSRYLVYASCVNGDSVIKTVTIPAGFTVTAPAVNPILFKPLGLGTNISDGSSVTITVTNTSINYSNSVKIGSSGDIQQ